MKPEAQRIAIAEACGWVAPTDDSPFNIPDEPESGLNLAFYWTDPSGRMASRPDYLNDLNAMHEAEKTLGFEQVADMAELIGVDADDAPADSWNKLLRATAAQRAEAFLRIIGKWEE